MNNKLFKALLAIAPVLFVVNIPVFAILFINAGETTSEPNPDQISSTLTEVSSSDIASGGDLTITPMVSEADIPEVILTSLSGTDTAEHIDEIAEKYHCTGLTVAVIKDGQVSFHYESGFANKKKTLELNQNTKFRIASLTKVYTSMLGMKLVEDGLADLDKDVGDVFGYQVRNPYCKHLPITLRMLLTHTASFRDRSTYIFSGDIRYDVEDRDAYYCREPGAGFTYSNLGMGIAGAMIEQVSGMQLTDYSNKVFFDGMEIDAAFNGSTLKDQENIADCISGVKLERSAAELIKPHGNKDPGQNHSVGAGGLIISAVDYAKVISLLINEGSYRGVSYLSPDTVSDIHEVQFEHTDFDQCIGIRRSEDVLENRTVYYHTGAAYGIFSLAIYDLTDKSGVVVFTTGSYAASNNTGIKLSCLETAELIYKDIIDGNKVPMQYEN